jgi:hypothetical protein
MHDVANDKLPSHFTNANLCCDRITGESEAGTVVGQLRGSRLHVCRRKGYGIHDKDLGGDERVEQRREKGDPRSVPFLGGE